MVVDAFDSSIVVGAQNFTVSLSINQININTDSPFFEKELEEQIVKSNALSKYELPEAMCEQDCSIEVALQRGDASSFTSFNSNTRSLQFVPKGGQEGSYQVTLKLTSLGTPNIVVFSSFNLTVIEDLNSDSDSPSDEEEQQSDLLIDID